ncbi:hypothetical protein E2C01_001240 [Portunus trituberculatus]|uniref:Uncharacterized protein n=1 Tax=Portunus trituberculatus TaxID=210409 RepID=A0A5B7CGM7_PORTR|nr:hypothetical protein [Portunus trituberculatus]
MSSSSDESSPASTGLGPMEEARKRRRRDVATWKRNMQKKHRDTGEEYTMFYYAKLGNPMPTLASSTPKS